MDPIETFNNLPPEQQQEIAKQGMKAVEKLSNGIGKVLGYFFEAKHMKQMADAEAYKTKVLADAKAYEINTLGEAIRNNKDLPIKLNNIDNTLSVDITNTDQLIQRSNLRLQYQQAKKEHNIESVIGKTILELGDKTVDTTEEIDEDWFTRFFKTVEDISDEQVQTLWARILAGEVLKPRTYTYRFLTVLKNISKNELDIVLRFAPFVIGGIALNEQSLLIKYNIDYQSISLLEDMGLLKEGGLHIGQVQLAGGEEKIILQNSKYAFIFQNNANEGIHHMFDILEITETGKKIFELANVDLDMNYIENALRIQFKDYNKLSIFAAEITGRENGFIQVSDNHIFEINIKKEN